LGHGETFVFVIRLSIGYRYQPKFLYWCILMPLHWPQGITEQLRSSMSIMANKTQLTNAQELS